MIDIILEEYKNITEKLIKYINNDEEIIKLMEKRQELIQNLFSYEKNREEIRKLYLAKDLLRLDEELKFSIEEERNKIKEEIKNLHKVKNANNAYEKNRKINNFFNTKI
ncbi:flagellar protein FliT [Clostridium sp. AL.422]|uniref:flagellar protein FliT n=1 Tax=Clostridium TaxID=1485 RepID=UPI00293DBB0F|nr:MULTISPECIES: flagellar protein FliT [unclassified Clostridium]MDV4149718.1 flagellar protein FliT [Clostridium sp. AL.422]